MHGRCLRARPAPRPLCAARPPERRSAGPASAGLISAGFLNPRHRAVIFLSSFCPAWVAQALAQALQSHILVYSAGLPVVELGEEFKGGPA